MDYVTENFTPEQWAKIKKAVEVAENDNRPLLSIEEARLNLKAHVYAYNLKQEQAHAHLYSEAS